MKYFLFITIIFFSLDGVSQSEETPQSLDSIPWEIRKQSFIYTSATRFNDQEVARMALYSLLAENPTNVAIYDTLSLLYLQYKKYASAALVSQAALSLDADNQFALEVAGVSFENLGIKEKAIEHFEKLYLINNKVETLYKVSFLQYELSRFEEANTALEIIIGSPDAQQSKVFFPAQKGGQQEVSLKTASMRLQAMIYDEKGNEEEAKKKFLEVLNISPGLEIVQRQLQEVGKQSTEKE